MALSSCEIDEVVRRVLEHLQTTGTEKEFPHGSSHSQTAEMPGHVVTTEQIAQCPAGTSICVQANAVVTPAAIDMLRDRKMTLRRSSGETQDPPRPRLLWMVNTVSTFDLQPLCEALRRQGVSPQTKETRSLIEAIQMAVDHIRTGGSRAVVLTGKTAAAVCMANRADGVRALHAGNVEEVERAFKEIAPNLLVLDPAGGNRTNMTHVVRCFCGAEATEPAPQYKQVLAAVGWNAK